MSELVGAFRAVLFCPEHLALVKGGPAERRQFLDIAISAENPLYLATLQRYAHVLKQRNALIKKAKDEPKSFAETVEIWSHQLAVEASYIARERARYIKKLEKFVAATFGEMMGEREKPTLSYLGCDKREDADYENIADTEAYLFGRLSGNLERELGAGATLYGAHKDDLEILLNGHPARLFASQGQQRSLSLALKIAEGEICREDFGEYPVFLFDDVLSELDASRRAFLLSRMAGKQVIMTSCEGKEAMSDLCVRVQNGRIIEE
jgi:DNA replication and repair protein RecF